MTMENQDVDVNENVDPAAPAKRRYFSTEQKLSILADYEAASEPGAKGALLRREGSLLAHH